MRHKTSILTGMAAILVLLFAPPMSMAGKDEAAWTVVAASGQVETTTEFDDPARWEPVSRGMNLMSASRIRPTTISSFPVIAYSPAILQPRRTSILSVSCMNPQ